MVFVFWGQIADKNHSKFLFVCTKDTITDVQIFNCDFVHNVTSNPFSDDNTTLISNHKNRMLLFSQGIYVYLYINTNRGTCMNKNTWSRNHPNSMPRFAAGLPTRTASWSCTPSLKTAQTWPKLCNELDMPQPLVSRHLKILRERGIGDHRKGAAR